MTPSSPLPAVAVTSTTERIRGLIRLRVNEAYTNALSSARLRPFVLPVLSPDMADTMLDGMHGLVLTGGEDIDPAHFGEAPHPKLGEVHAQRDAFEIALARAAFARRLPTLAICRGMQVANVAFGGTLIQDIGSEREGALVHDKDAQRSERVHSVRLQPGSKLAAVLGAAELAVNSSHHQALAEVARGFVPVGQAADGIVEGAEWSGGDWWFLAVQWHPEELTETTEPWDRSLFAAFAEACRNSAR